MDKRYGRAKWGVNGTRVKTGAANWKKPLAWNREAEAKGIRYRVFCASLADVFEDREELDQYRLDLLNLIFLTPKLDWLLLTKRPENIMELIKRATNQYYLSTSGNHSLGLGHWLLKWEKGQEPDNIWLGASIENQEVLMERANHLFSVPAAVRFFSMEPLLSEVDFTPLTDKLKLLGGRTLEDYLGWVIVGGESGANARPMRPEWVKFLRTQCRLHNIPFHFKQWGEYTADFMPIGMQTMVDEIKSKKIVGVTVTGDIVDYVDGPGSPIMMRKVGKQAAGNRLENEIYDAVPIVNFK